MKLFLLERREGYEAEYDENEGFVIAAETHSEARKIAANSIGSRHVEEPITWLNAERSKITCIGSANLNVEPGIVLTDFKAG